jgi:ABC-type branched-subunit amino acid transport system substrate-binding protein
MSPKVVVIDAIEATLYGPSARSFRLGAVLPLSGTLGQAGPSALEALILAAEELQATRSPGQRSIELVLIDAGAPAQSVAQTVAQLARAGIVEAFVGLHTSDVLEAIEVAAAGFPVPYVFTAGHESREQPPGFYSPGESPAEMAQGVGRVMDARDVREWAIIGSDYIWPHAVGAAARKVIEMNAGRVVLDQVIPLHGAMAASRQLLSDITSSGAEGLIVSMPGRELITILTALHDTELDREFVVYSGTLEENVLYALGGNLTGNLYSTQHSFETLASPRRVELNERFAVALGDDSPAVNSWAEHCYDAVHLMVGLERAGLLDARCVSEYRCPPPEGVLELLPHYSIQLAVAAGMRFEIM